MLRCRENGNYAGNKYGYYHRGTGQSRHDAGHDENPGTIIAPTPIAVASKRDNVALSADGLAGLFWVGTDEDMAQASG